MRTHKIKKLRNIYILLFRTIALFIFYDSILNDYFAIIRIIKSFSVSVEHFSCLMFTEPEPECTVSMPPSIFFWGGSCWMWMKWWNLIFSGPDTAERQYYMVLDFRCVSIFKTILYLGNIFSHFQMFISHFLKKQSHLLSLLLFTIIADYGIWSSFDFKFKFLYI